MYIFVLVLVRAIITSLLSVILLPVIYMHQDGPDKRVGNPLSKDFLSKIEEGILSSAVGNEAGAILKYSKMTSYWKNNLGRIK